MRESEIVAVCFLAEENAEGVGFLLIHLKNNPNSSAVRVVWICVMCQQDIEEADSIECDLCLEWYHSKCTSFQK